MKTIKGPGIFWLNLRVMMRRLTHGMVLRVGRLNVVIKACNCPVGISGLLILKRRPPQQTTVMKLKVWRWQVV